jgi:hypothetical protein
MSGLWTVSARQFVIRLLGMTRMTDRGLQQALAQRAVTAGGGHRSDVGGRGEQQHREGESPHRCRSGVSSAGGVVDGGAHLGAVVQAEGFAPGDLCIFRPAGGQ